jgi:hypothetical protein
MQFDVRELDHLPEKTGAVVFLESAIPFAATAAACAVALAGLEPAGVAAFGRDAIRDALVLGACAAPAAPVAAVALARTSGSPAAAIVARVTALNDVAGVVVLALVCSFFRPADEIGMWKLPAVAWTFVTLGMGGVLGILAHVLLRGAQGPAEETAYLLGAVALSAGMSGYLAVSPLVVCAVAGAVLTNLPQRHVVSLRDAILQLERPLYLIFLLVAGALWQPMAWQGWFLAPVFALARVGAKVFSAHAAVRAGPAQLPDAGTLGLALSPQSPIAIATIVGFATLYGGAEAPGSRVPWMTTAVIGSAVLTEIAVQAIARLRGGLRFDLDPLSIPPPGEQGAPPS